jgi:RHS repeat-associated protein
VKTIYNTNGYPEKLTRASDGYGYVTVNAMDAYGHATALTEGNGARVMRAYDQATGLALQTQASSRAHGLIANLTTAWDGFGNLKTRTATDPATHITRTERANYDDLNRLKQTVLTLEGGGSRTLTFAYADNGNRTQKCVNGRCTTYGYGGSAGPHALTSVNGAGNYDYDANGAMLHDGDKTLAWSAFGKAMYIGTQQGTVGFAYGPDRARYQKRVNSAYGEAETVTYLQGAERLQFADGQASIRRTLAFAGVSVIDTGGIGAKVLYAVKDHLGSIMALSDASGGLAQQMAFSPFGKRRTAGWAHGMDIPTAWQINTTETDKGYTGQESLDAVQLVDYNARLYDPALGRFLSVDPLIAHPGSTQSINPYSYVENNPLNKTDPTGEADQCADSDDSCNPPPATKPKPKPTATGSHIPGTMTKVGNALLTTMGPGSMMVAARPRQGTTAQNSMGGDSNKVSKHNFNQKDTGTNGNSHQNKEVDQSHSGYVVLYKKGDRYTQDIKKRRDLAPIVKDPTVKAAMKQAWKESHPDGSPALGTAGPEHGFWVYRNDTSGSYSVRWISPDKLIDRGHGIDVGPAPKIKGEMPVVFFHTHPFRNREPWPSQADFGFVDTHHVAGILMSEVGPWYYGPNVP